MKFTPFRLFDSKAKVNFKRKLVSKILKSLQELDVDLQFEPVQAPKNDTELANELENSMAYRT